MAVATVSPDFEIVIPEEVHERLDLRPGQRVAFIDRDGCFALVPERPISALRGIAKGAPTDDYRDETDRF